MIEEILNELKISNFTYDKQSGIIKVNTSLNPLSEELGKITSSLKEYQIVFSVDRKHNIRIE